MKQVHIIVSGFVQGVGYRRFVRHHARKLNVTGWVMNLPTRQVEAVLQGEEENVKKLLEICKKGPFLSEVTNVVVEWEEVTNVFSEFSIDWQ